MLNTSFNMHGAPMVCAPAHAIDVFRQSGADWLAIGSFLIGAEQAARRGPLEPRGGAGVARVDVARTA